MGTETCIRIRIAEDFTEFPGGRYRTDGDNSGQQFREDLLIPKLMEAVGSGCVLEVVLDGVAGYGSSFLEEAFGGLVRADRFSPDDIRRSVRVVAETPQFSVHRIEAEQYIEDALRQGPAGGRAYG